LAAASGFEALQPKTRAERPTSHTSTAAAAASTEKSNHAAATLTIKTLLLKKEIEKKHAPAVSRPIFLYTRFFGLPLQLHQYCIHCIINTTIMANPNAGHFFQTSESLVAEQRKANKAQNKLGRPIKLSSKLLAVTADPFDERAVYVAEAAGEVRRVVLEVSFWHLFLFPSYRRIFLF
jgi:hypothetical protein